jgi:hypothetical protein
LNDCNGSYPSSSPLLSASSPGQPKPASAQSPHSSLAWSKGGWRGEGNAILNYAIAFGMYLGINVGLAVVGLVITVYFEPTAAGSGIPEVKAYLNGTKVNRQKREGEEEKRKGEGERESLFTEPITY